MPAMTFVQCPNCAHNLEIRAVASKAESPRTPYPEEKPSTNNVGALLSKINDDELSGKNQEFIISTRARYKQYGSKIMMSPKSLQWLQDIAEKF